MFRLKKMKSLSAAAALGIVLVQASAAHAVTKTWLAGDGRWDNPLKWSPTGVPTAADDVVINQNGTYLVNFVAGNFAVNSLALGGGTGVQTLKVGQNILTINSASSVASSGVVLLNGSGTITGSGNITVDSGATFNFSGGNLLGGSQLNISTGAVLNIDGTPKSFLRVINNAGTATWTGSAGVNVLDGSAINNSGTFTVNMPTSGSMVNDAAGVNPSFVNSGTLNKNGSAVGSFTNVSLANSGTVNVNAGQLGVNYSGPVATYTQTAGATNLTAGCTLSAPSATISGGVFSGNGTFSGNLTNNATVEPGGAGTAGVILVLGNYIQGASGVLNIDIGGTTAPTQYDVLGVGGAGNATLGGTLNVNLINGFVPDPGNDNGCNGPDIFTPIGYLARTGTFATTNIDPSGPEFFTIAYGNGAGVVSLTTNTTAPVVSGFSPDTNIGSGTLVTITGRNFTGITSVEFNGVEAATFTVNSTTQITATAPANLTAGAIRVTNAIGSSTSCGSYTVDSSQPNVAINPAANDPSCSLNNGISGTAADAESGITAVSITLRRASDGMFWNGSAWASTASMIPATLGAGTWSVAAGSLPTGADLPNGVYQVWAFAFDNAGNLRTTKTNVTINSAACLGAFLRTPSE